MRSRIDGFVSRLADAVFVETHGESYLTCIVVRLDEETRQLTVTTAGHPPALVTGATFRRLTAGGPPAGLFPHADYDEETVDLAPGSRVLFVTDGITEQLSGGLEGAIAQLDSHGSAEDLCAAVFRLSEGPAASPPVAGWDDDRTVVVLAIDSEETMWRRAAQQWPIIREVGCS